MKFEKISNLIEHLNTIFNFYDNITTLFELNIQFKF